LSEVFSDTTTAAVLLEAFDVHGEPLGEEVEPVLTFVRGPLSRSIASRLSKESAAALLAKIQRTLAGATKPPPPPVRRPRPPPMFDHPTHRVDRTTGPARVIVLSKSEGLSDRLKAALGGHRIAVAWTEDSPTVSALAQGLNAKFVLVDATDPPEIDPELLAAVLADLPPELLCVVWSRGELYARRLLDAAGRRAIKLVPLDRAEGVEPLFDLLRSHADA
jgi:hypothetical protein